MEFEHDWAQRLATYGMANFYYDLGWYRACEEESGGSYMSFRYQFSHVVQEFGAINLCLPAECSS